MKIVFTSLLILLSMHGVFSQDELPFSQIPEAEKDYSAVNVLSRMIDGLGFRYYWATEELRPDDLAFTPGNNGRNCEETLDHIAGLSNTILNAAKNQVNTRIDWSEYSWEEKRAKTLSNFKEASDLFKQMKSKDLDKQKIIFERDGKRSEYPMWNLINGPIADAIYHTGQVVSYRRSAGNPQPAGVNVFKGTHKHPH